MLLVQACEEADPDGQFLTKAERERAGRAAAALAPRERDGGRDAAKRVVIARAEPLATSLEARWPSLSWAVTLVGLEIPAAVVVVLALLGGLILDRLGETRRINLLAFPLMGLLAWNLAVYAILATRRWWRPMRQATRLPAVAHVILRLLARAPWLGGGDAGRWLAAAMRRFVRAWLAAAGRLTHARAARLLHLGAAAFAAGAVLGMYVRGLAFEYRAGWESTFLDTAAVRTLLAVVLGPAAAVLHLVAPSVAPAPAALFSAESIERLKGPAAAGEAAIWIHLWTTTIVLVVVLPRVLLAWRARRHERNLAAHLDLPLDDPYYLRLLAAGRGGGVRIEVLPYSYRPSARAIQRVDAVLLDLFGSRARLSHAEPVAYGETPELPSSGPAEPVGIVVLFNLAQSPEPEVHGELIEALCRHVEPGSAKSLLLVLDEEPYQARLGADAARLLERRRAWERLAADAGLGMVWLPGAGTPDVDTLASARAALHDSDARRPA